MEKRARKPETAHKSPVRDDRDVTPNPHIIETGRKLQEDTDALVEEIDEVLEDNPAEFVKNYVQKGGE